MPGMSADEQGVKITGEASERSVTAAHVESDSHPVQTEIVKPAMLASATRPMSKEPSASAPKRPTPTKARQTVGASLGADLMILESGKILGGVGLNLQQDGMNVFRLFRDLRGEIARIHLRMCTHL